MVISLELKHRHAANNGALAAGHIRMDLNPGLSHVSNNRLAPKLACHVLRPQAYTCESNILNNVIEIRIPIQNVLYCFMFHKQTQGTINIYNIHPTFLFTCFMLLGEYSHVI